MKASLAQLALCVHENIIKFGGQSVLPKKVQKHLTKKLYSEPCKYLFKKVLKSSWK